MHILITGNMGYVGPVLTRFLRKKMPKACLTGFDTGFFAHALTGAESFPETLLSEQHFGDIRLFPRKLLHGVDAVVHLAAVSNDPMGKEFEEVTEQINQKASVNLAVAAAAAGVKNFVFASSCSMYGYAEGEARKETDPANPLTAYARSKIDTEEGLRRIDLGQMVFTSLRFATACGMSDRLRLDLVLNDFVACALSSGEISVLSDGSPWRPLIDVEDMARAIDWATTRKSKEGGCFLAVNAGRDEGNYQIKHLAETVAAYVPGTRVSINTSAPPDSRSYKVDFSLFKKLAPGAIPQKDLNESIQGLIAGLRRMKFINAGFRESPFMRLNTLKGHLKAGRLDKNLNWALPRRSHLEARDEDSPRF